MRMLASHQPLNQVQQVTITENHEGQRVDNFLFNYLRGVPKSRLYRIIRKGEVRVNKCRISVCYRLQTGDIVRIPPIRKPVKEEISHHPGKKLSELLASSICYEDDHLLVVNKPAGMAVHGGSGVSLGLIEALRAMRPSASFLELVHRLDRETSGCIMIAKRRSMLIHLHDSLKAGEIEKKYFALVKGKWQGKRIVDAPLLKFVLRSGERMVKVDPEGKVARTLFEPLEIYAQATLMSAKPITGRTHQIRVHCTFMGHPIAGDQKYGDAAFNHQMKTEGCERLFLHAHELIIKLPYEPFTLKVTAPLPMALEKYCLSLRT